MSCVKQAFKDLFRFDMGPHVDDLVNDDEMVLVACDL